MMRCDLSVLLVTLFGMVFPGAVHADERANVVSLEGNWTVVAKKENGEDINNTNLFGIMTDKGSKLSMYANGYGRFQEDNDVYWAFDKNKRTFALQQKARFTFGWTTWIADASANRVEDTVVLKGTRTLLDGKTTFPVEVTLVPTHLASLHAASIQLDQKTFDRDFFTEEYETRPGVKKNIVLRKEYETSVTATATAGIEVGMEAKAEAGIASITGSLRGKIEASLGTTIGTRDVFEENYELDGKEHVSLTVKWVKRYRKGTIILADGKKQPFEVFIGYRTIPEYSK